MNFVALKMLTGDRAKYLAPIFAIAFSTFLLENQASFSQVSFGEPAAKFASPGASGPWIKTWCAFTRPWVVVGQAKPRWLNLNQTHINQEQD